MRLRRGNVQLYLQLSLQIRNFAPMIRGKRAHIYNNVVMAATQAVSLRTLSFSLSLSLCKYWAEGLYGVADAYASAAFFVLC